MCVGMHVRFQGPGSDWGWGGLGLGGALGCRAAGVQGRGARDTVLSVLHCCLAVGRTASP